MARARLALALALALVERSTVALRNPTTVFVTPRSSSSIKG